jgi:hypothetical protein
MRASAAAARALARPARTLVPVSTARISAMSPLQCRTMSQPAASAARARWVKSPLSAFIDRSSVIRRPSKPIVPRITSRIALREVVAGARGSIAV